MKVKSLSEMGAALHTKVCVFLITIMMFNQVAILPANASFTTNEIGDVITTEVGGEDVIVDNPEPIINEVIVEEKVEEVTEVVGTEPRVIMHSVDLSSRSGALEREPIISNVVHQPEPEPVVEKLEPYANAKNVREPSNATADDLLCKEPSGSQRLFLSSSVEQNHR